MSKWAETPEEVWYAVLFWIGAVSIAGLLAFGWIAASPLEYPEVWVVAWWPHFLGMAMLYAAVHCTVKAVKRVRSNA